MGWAFGPKTGILWSLQQESNIYCLTLVSLVLTFKFFVQIGRVKEKVF